MDWLGSSAALEAAAENGTLNDLDERLFAPVITAAFWSEGETLTAGEPWQSVYWHGAHILQLELSDADLALPEHQTGWDLTPEQIALARELYEQRLSATSLPMRLTAEEHARLNVQGEIQRTAIEKYLAAIKIALPDAF